jgi:hypothetical protein
VVPRIHEELDCDAGPDGCWSPARIRVERKDSDRVNLTGGSFGIKSVRASVVGGRVTKRALAGFDERFEELLTLSYQGWRPFRTLPRFAEASSNLVVPPHNTWSDLRDWIYFETGCDPREHAQGGSAGVHVRASSTEPKHPYCPYNGLDGGLPDGESAGRGGQGGRESPGRSV